MEKIEKFKLDMETEASHRSLMTMICRSHELQVQIAAVARIITDPSRLLDASCAASSSERRARSYEPATTSSSFSYTPMGRLYLALFPYLFQIGLLSSSPALK